MFKSYEKKLFFLGGGGGGGEVHPQIRVKVQQIIIIPVLLIKINSRWKISENLVDIIFTVDLYKKLSQNLLQIFPKSANTTEFLPTEVSNIKVTVTQGISQIFH